MIILLENLNLDRCPLCGIDSPNLESALQIDTRNSSGSNRRFWRIYKCYRCGGLVTASSKEQNGEVYNLYPQSPKVDESIPEKARVFLSQALSSNNAPSGAIMLCASSVNIMLKEKGYIDGSLFARIKSATEQHLITDEMALWAHEVRLEANDQRHSDKDSGLPTIVDAERTIEFVKALAEFLFVLPSKVRSGLKDAKDVQ